MNKLDEMKHDLISGEFKGFDGDILDIGCGDGNNSYLKRVFDKCSRAGKIVGIDRAPTSIDQIKNLLQLPNFEAIVMDAEEMNFPPNSFDAIIAGDIIGHLRDPKRSLLTCHKMLRPNGKIIITTPNRNDLGNLIKKIFGREKRFPIVWYYPSGVQDVHYFEFTKGELKVILSETGYELIKLKQFYFVVPKTKYALKLFAPLSQMLFAVAIKSQCNPVS